MYKLQGSNKIPTKKWFAKTLYSIEETAAESLSGLSKAPNATRTSITRSSSVDALHLLKTIFDSINWFESIDFGEKGKILDPYL